MRIIIGDIFESYVSIETGRLLLEATIGSTRLIVLLISARLVKVRSTFLNKVYYSVKISEIRLNLFE